MQLSRIEIKGFKSFGDKITINFNEGVTAIVGPNGSGKSNIVDSIRWVLGEQSARALRSEKMDNVIFNGSKGRKAANLAEVALTFNNTANILRTDFSEVTISRRYYRSGESEFRINDTQCRLKDITDLFLNTGIGTNSYSIIELNMVGEIIENKEGSRRNLFDEASGISKYKLRKKQSFHELKFAEADLERIESLLTEIEKNLQQLETQAKKTSRYNDLKEQYKSLSCIAAGRQINAFTKSLERIQDAEQRCQIERSGISTQINSLEAQLQEKKLEKLNKEELLHRQQGELNDLNAAIDIYENEKKIKNEELIFLREKETSISQQLSDDRNSINKLSATFEQLDADRTQESNELKKLESALSEFSANKSEIGRQVSVSGELLKQAKAVVETSQSQLQTKQNELAFLEVQRRSLADELGRNNTLPNQQPDQLLNLESIVANLQNEVKSAETVLQVIIENENKLQQQIRNKEAELQTLSNAVDNENRKLDAAQNEFNLTKSLVDGLEHYPDSVKFLKRSADWVNSTKILFSDIFSCPDEFRAAIENYLDPLLNYYVVETYNEAANAIKLLSASAKGKAQFFILSKFEELLPPVAEDIPGAMRASSIIEVEDKYRKICEHLLGNVFLVDDTKEDQLNSAPLANGVTLLGKSGRFNKSRHVIAGGSLGLFDGKRIGRVVTLDKLGKTISAHEKILARYKNQSDILKSELVRLRGSSGAGVIKERQRRITMLNTQLTKEIAKTEAHRKFVADAAALNDNIGQKLVSVANLITALDPQIAELGNSLEDQRREMTARQVAFDELNESMNLQSDHYNRQMIGLQDQQSKVSGLEKDLEHLTAEQTMLEKRITSNTATWQQIQADVTENLKISGESDDRLLSCHHKRLELQEKVSAAEQDYYSKRSEIQQLENEIYGIRQKKSQADDEESRIKDQRSELKLELNALKERLSVEFNIDIRELPDTPDQEDANDALLLEKTGKLKKLLNDFGAINPLALEAYNEMSERYHYILSQRKDLNDAKASLLTTIQEIDNTAKEKFLSAFGDIRENFIKVFRSLFGEQDFCDLFLTDPDRPLESDIGIVAKPRGKQPLSINQLSVGEKTVTAIAILFSLYLLKPAPFCVFDEIDAPLDDTNIDKLNNILRRFSGDTQFIIISHNKKMITMSDVVYGITMVEQGISRVVPVDLMDFEEY